jgi:hypothetical protein
VKVVVRSIAGCIPARGLVVQDGTDEVEIWGVEERLDRPSTRLPVSSPTLDRSSHPTQPHLRHAENSHCIPVPSMPVSSILLANETDPFLFCCSSRGGQTLERHFSHRAVQTIKRSGLGLAVIVLSELNRVIPHFKAKVKTVEKCDPHSSRYSSQPMRAVLHTVHPGPKISHSCRTSQRPQVRIHTK